MTTRPAKIRYGLWIGALERAVTRGGGFVGAAPWLLPCMGLSLGGKAAVFGIMLGIDNESDEADRAISTGKLHALPRFHTRPIDVVVYHGSDREHWF